MPIAAFDFDGTLTTRDTMLEFIRFVRGDRALKWGFVRLAPMLLGFKFGLIPRQRAKERLLAYFFEGEEQAQLERWGKDFCRQVLPSLLRQDVVTRLAWHQAEGHACYLVTASLSIWTRPCAEALGLRLVASEPSYLEARFSGRLLGKNCYGPEKVRRLEAVLEGTDPGRRFAYGDSRGDRELLEWADEGVLIR